MGCLLNLCELVRTLRKTNTLMCNHCSLSWKFPIRRMKCWKFNTWVRKTFIILQQNQYRFLIGRFIYIWLPLLDIFSHPNFNYKWYNQLLDFFYMVPYNRHKIILIKNQFCFVFLGELNTILIHCMKKRDCWKNGVVISTPTVPIYQCTLNKC